MTQTQKITVPGAKIKKVHLTAIHIYGISNYRIHMQWAGRSKNGTIFEKMYVIASMHTFSFYRKKKRKEKNYKNSLQ